MSKHFCTCAHLGRRRRDVHRTVHVAGTPLGLPLAAVGLAVIGQRAVTASLAIGQWLQLRLARRGVHAATAHYPRRGGVLENLMPQMARVPAVPLKAHTSLPRLRDAIKFENN